jgi:hypothetical protein
VANDCFTWHGTQSIGIFISYLLSIFYEHPQQPEQEPEQLFPDEEPADCNSPPEDDIPDLIGVNTLIISVLPQISHFISSELSFLT